MKMSFYLISPEVYAWVILPLLIFIARIFDVSLETIRVVYISKGIKFLAPIIAFFEILIWLLAFEVVLSNLSNIATFLAFAAGFAMGTYIGLLIEEKLSIGMVVVRIITSEGADELMEKLKAGNYGVTRMEGVGAREPVTVLLTLVDRHDLHHLIGLINESNPHAFYSIEDIRTANEGVFRPRKHGVLRFLLDMFRPHSRRN